MYDDKEMELRHVKMEWQYLLNKLSDRFDGEPDLQVVLFLIGLQETGFTQKKLSKDEKQDLVHVAICSILCPLGYYTYQHHDEEGWPHYQSTGKLPAMSLKDQDILIRKAVISYFKKSGFLR